MEERKEACAWRKLDINVDVIRGGGRCAHARRSCGDVCTVEVCTREVQLWGRGHRRGMVLM